ncbi:HATPase_UhpB-NarQ-NarX-like domain containing protein [Candidatus Nanopelagicaceae bacterium]
MSEQTPEHAFQERTWQERLGGPYAVSSRAFIITSLLALVYLLQVQNIASLAADEILKWLAIYVVAIAIVGTLNWVLERTTFAKRGAEPVSPVVAFVNHGVHGLLFGLALYDGSKILGLNYSGNVIYQLTVTVLLALWWGPMLAIFLDHRTENGERRRALVERAVATESLSIHQLQSRNLLDEILRSEVATELALAETELRRDAVKEDHVAVSALLRRTAREKVRPISHEMAKLAAINYPRIRWWRLPINIVNNQPINVVMIIAIALVGGGAHQIELLGLSNALKIMITLYIFIAVFGFTANSLMKRFPEHHASFFIGTSLLLQLSIPINVHFREIWAPGNSSLGWQIQQLLSGLVLIITTSGFGAWSAINKRLNANFSEDIDYRRIEAIAASRHIADQTREAARVLHGEVQTKLVACAMAIDHAAALGDEKKLDLAITQALTVLTTPISTNIVTESLQEEIARKVSLWDQICAISLTIAQDLPIADSGKISQIGRVVEEGISNAVRHGRAKSVSIEISKAWSNSFEIRIVDDGIGPGSGVPSLGSALLDQASAGNWSLKKVENGCLLRVEIKG